MAKIESLSSRERKDMIASLENIFTNPGSVLPKKGKTQKHFNDRNEIGFVANNRDLVIIYKDGFYIPSLTIARNLDLKLPKVVVDTGAIRFVTNGADVMRPGITHIDDEVIEGSLVVVVEEKNGAPLAFGKSMYDAVDMREMDGGRVVTNLHHLKDDWFEFVPY